MPPALGIQLKPNWVEALIALRDLEIERAGPCERRKFHRGAKVVIPVRSLAKQKLAYINSEAPYITAKGLRWLKEAGK